MLLRRCLTFVAFAFAVVLFNVATPDTAHAADATVDITGVFPAPAPMIPAQEPPASGAESPVGVLLICVGAFLFAGGLAVVASSVKRSPQRSRARFGVQLLSVGSYR